MEALRKYIDAQIFAGGDSGCEAILDQLYQAGVYKREYQDRKVIRSDYKLQDKS